MKWQNHIIIGASFGAVINPLVIPMAVLGATAPDWIEYILKIFGIKVKHRGVTHVVLYWLAAIAFFALVGFTYPQPVSKTRQPPKLAVLFRSFTTGKRNMTAD